MSSWEKCPNCKQDTIFNKENKGFWTYGEEGGFYQLWYRGVWLLCILMIGIFLVSSWVGYVYIYTLKTVMQDKELKEYFCK